MSQRSLKGSVVRVSWDDAWQSEDYFTDGDAEAEKPKLIDSYGLVIRDDRQALVIAMDDLRPTGDVRFRDVKYIPRAMVRRIKVLK